MCMFRFDADSTKTPGSGRIRTRIPGSRAHKGKKYVRIFSKQKNIKAPYFTRMWIRFSWVRIFQNKKNYKMCSRTGNCERDSWIQIKRQEETWSVLSPSPHTYSGRVSDPGFGKKKTNLGLCTPTEGRFLKLYWMNILAVPLTSQIQKIRTGPGT